jgi:hypothetical protein
MRNLFLAVVGVFAVSGVASAQPSAAVAPPRPLPLPALSPAAATAASPIIQTGGGGPAYRGDGCATGDCGKGGFTMKHVNNAPANNCQLGYPCANGCGGVRSDLAFHFGSCKSFFSPCGPQYSGLFGTKCPSQPFNTPWGQGWQCPRGYDSYTNH